MRMMISFAALFLSVTLLQLSLGRFGPLDALTDARPPDARQRTPYIYAPRPR